MTTEEAIHANHFQNLMLPLSQSDGPTVESSAWRLAASYGARMSSMISWSMRQDGWDRCSLHNSFTGIPQGKSNLCTDIAWES